MTKEQRYAVRKSAKICRAIYKIQKDIGELYAFTSVNHPLGRDVREFAQLVSSSMRTSNEAAVALVCAISREIEKQNENYRNDRS